MHDYVILEVSVNFLHISHLKIFFVIHQVLEKCLTNCSGYKFSVLNLTIFVLVNAFKYELIYSFVNLKAKVSMLE